MLQNKTYILNKPLKINTYAKVNFYLDILKKMPNSYHEILTLFSTLELSDNICFYLSKNDLSSDFILKQFKIQFEKPVSGIINMQNEKLKLTFISDEEYEKCFFAPLDTQNSVYVAIKKMLASCSISSLDEEYNLYVIFQKNIPAGAGLAGGSSNAAGALIALNNLLQLNCGIEKLKEIGLKVGADVPYMLEGGTLLAGGTGEDFLSKYDIPQYPIILVYPNFEVSAKDAYTNVQNHFKYDLMNITDEQYEKIRKHSLGRAEKLIHALNCKDYPAVCKMLYNKLEEPVFTRKHQIRELKENICKLGFQAVLMSGSGSTIYTVLDPSASEETIKSQFNKLETEIHKKYSKTYKVILTKTRKAIAWDKMLAL
ncbi:MAG: hypothetical protein QMC67_11595 [Candidatus Wallbacteria bacterium]